MDCCSWGVSVRCCDSLSWRLCFMSRDAGETDHPLEAEVLSEIHLSDSLIIDDLLRLPEREDRALVDDVGVVADAERLAHVVVGDEHADAVVRAEVDDLLDVARRAW